ncbi:hypothetical protein J4526_05875 [Desulfurococcaceae archaeon MEX13E-LK6-19]|nr:hypothetical protein J4526_05875 [Desulfurococcaceae archaeon MEX13E-LK6-19]
MKKWCLLKLTLLEVPYQAYVLDHFLGEVAALEEVGRISEDTVELIRQALNYSRDEELVIDYKKIPLIPLEDIREEDRLVLEKILDKINDDTFIVIKECVDERS